MLRPSDHIDSAQANPGEDARGIRLGVVGWLRWAWRQITSMRTALILLLLLAIASIPGSIFPQRSSDPNGVTQYFVNNPDLAPWLDGFQLFDVYASVWFSAIYLLLFISLVGCVIPRAKHHWDALRGVPPATPQNLNRLPAHLTARMPGIAVDAAIDAAERVLRRDRYRVRRYDSATRLTVSAERGYMRETGNLVFHVALVGVLIAVGLGGGFGYAGQRVVVEGQAFTNSLIAYDSFSPGRFFSDSTLTPFSLRLDKFTTRYEERNVNAVGQPIDYTADVTIEERGKEPVASVIKVNEPLNIGGSDVYLLGNGYAPEVTVRDPDGNVVYQEAVPFLPQDTNFTSVGVVKLPDGLTREVGLIAFFYPTVNEGHAGASFSVYPDLIDPLLTINVYVGDLGLNDGIPRSVYALDTSELTKLTGTTTDVPSLELRPGETADLPNGLGSVSLENVKRFASLDVHRDPAQGWVLIFALAAVAGLLTSLFIPRRRVWISARAKAEGTEVEYGALARGDDPTLSAALARIANAHGRNLGLERD